MKYIITFREENRDGKHKSIDAYLHGQRFYELCTEFDIDFREA